MNRKSKMVLLVGSLLTAASVQASVIWDGNAAKGTGVFNSIQNENQSGKVTVVSDSTYGKVFKMTCNNPTTNIKTRCEASGMKGFTPSNTGTYYFGWRHKWGPLPTKSGKWQVLEQIHLSGSASSGAQVPLGLSAPGDGKIHVNIQDSSANTHDIWSTSLPLNSWHKFVYQIKFATSNSGGFITVWYDGSQKTKFTCGLAKSGCTSYWKWGIYRSGSGGNIGTAVAYLQNPKAGTAYSDVSQ